MANPKKSKHPYLGIDLGGTNILAGVIDDKNRLLSRVKLKTKAEEGFKGVLTRLIDAVERASEDAQLKVSDLGGVGIGAPGTIDTHKGMVMVAVNLRWNKVPLGPMLAQRLRVPVVVDNDVNVGTWGEFKAGAGKGHSDVLGVFVGTGIGGGLVLNGQLYHGFHMTAGEVGHTVINLDAPRGRRTVENWGSRTAIVNRLTQLINANHESVLSKLTGGDLSAIRSKLLGQAMEQHDPLTEEVVGHAAKCVGVCIANVFSILSLECAVVGGGVTDALGKAYVDQVRQAFEEHVFPADLRTCPIFASKLGDDAGIIGAALLAREMMLKT